ncbi:MAG: esterase-like activity of phytase family protein [Myxococcales bacterium]
MSHIRKAVIAAVAALALAGSTDAQARPAQRVLNVQEFRLDNPPEAAPGLSAGGFSGITHIPGDPADIIYAINDRGPHSLVSGRRTFYSPELIPSIWKLRISEGQVEVLERIYIKRPDGTPISGRPNLSGVDETPYDWTGTTQLTFDPHGLDLEGISYDPVDDTFWLCDEYKTLINVRRDGTIIERLAPQGWAAMLNTGYVRDVFPAYYANMPRNRGFEAISVSPGGRVVFGAAQTPMNIPTAAVGNNSLMTRIAVLDLESRVQTAEYIFVRESVANYPTVLQVDVNIGDIHALSSTRLLVVERDKHFGSNSRLKKIFLADLSQATNVMGISSINGKSLEAMTPAELVANGITPMTKTLLVDVLEAIPGYPYEKLEGMTMIDSRKIVICADNDYGFEPPYMNPACHRIMFQNPIE